MSNPAAVAPMKSSAWLYMALLPHGLLNEAGLLMGFVLTYPAKGAIIHLSGLYVRGFRAGERTYVVHGYPGILYRAHDTPPYSISPRKYQRLPSKLGSTGPCFREDAGAENAGDYLKLNQSKYNPNILE